MYKLQGKINLIGMRTSGIVDKGKINDSFRLENL